MDIEEFRKAVDKRTGLVPMKITRPFMPYDVDQVAGFPPDQAFAYANVGNAEIFKGGEKTRGIKAHSGPEPGSGSVGRVPGPEVPAIRATAYDRRPEVTPRAQVAPATIASPTPAPAPAEIPDDWETSLTVARQRSLAADLSGRRYQELSGEEAKEIIRVAKGGGDLPPGGSDANILDPRDPSA